MTDLFRGFDLSVVADIVCEREWDRRVALSSLAPESKAGRLWSLLPETAKKEFRQQILPIVAFTVDALQDSTVQPPAPREMVEYVNGKYETDDAQLDKKTATVWALHLHVHRDVNLRTAILDRMAALPGPTGEWTWGDSWTEWGAETEWDMDNHMVVYFEAATPVVALVKGEHLAMHAALAAGDTAIAVDYAIGASGDYAEIIR